MSRAGLLFFFNLTNKQTEGKRGEITSPKMFVKPCILASQTSYITYTLF